MCEGQYGKLSFNLTFTFKINFRCDLVFKVRQKKSVYYGIISIPIVKFFMGLMKESIGELLMEVCSSGFQTLFSRHRNINTADHKIGAEDVLSAPVSWHLCPCAFVVPALCQSQMSSFSSVLFPKPQSIFEEGLTVKYVLPFFV